MVILTHGGDFGELWGVDGKVRLEEIFLAIRYCKTLIGKPKLFFIQACRGSEVDEGAVLPPGYETGQWNEPQQEPTQSIPLEPQQKPTQGIPLEADFFYAYSTTPGHYSFRNDTNGAWFIQAIYKVFTEHASTMELMQMMTRVHHMIAYEFTSNCEDLHNHKTKQVSSIVTMLTKELYFKPKPEQTMQLESVPVGMTKLVREEFGNDVEIKITPLDKFLKQPVFLHCLECQYGLLDHLQHNGCITAEDVIELNQGHRTEIERNIALIKLINPLNIDKFKQGLHASNQSHLANFINKSGKKEPPEEDDWPVNDSDIAPIVKSYPQLIRDLDNKSLVGQLLTNQSLNAEQTTAIISKITSQERNRELLSIVMRRSVRQLKIFVNYLEENYAYILSRSQELLRKSGFQKMCRITDLEHNRIIDALAKLRNLSTFSLRIPNILVEVNRVLIRYYTKNLDTEQTNQSSNDDQTKAASNLNADNIQQVEVANRIKASSAFTEYDFMRDVSLIRDTLKKIVPDAEIVMTKLNMVPSFRLTAGLSSRLLHVDDLAISNRIGCITALLNDSNMENMSGHTNDYALTAAHNIQVGNTVHIVSDNNIRSQIGTVQVTIQDNGDNYEHVDAALIRLEDNAINNLELRQRFSINGQQHRLSQLATERSQPGRVTIKAVDQDDDAYKGYISRINFDILDDLRYPDRYKLVQVDHYNEAGNHGGKVHDEGESGLLMTYEPMPERQGFVNPVVMLIGLYPLFDDEGNELYDVSVGVDLHRVLDRLSTRVREKLQLFQ